MATSRARRFIGDAPASTVLELEAEPDEDPGRLSTTERTVRNIAAAACVIELAPGLHLLEIDEVEETAGKRARTELPELQVSVSPRDPDQSMDIIGVSGAGGSWLDHGGGPVVVKVPPDGGRVIVTAYAMSGAAVVPGIKVRRLDRDRPDRHRPIAALAAAPATAGNISTEIILHVERLGDCRFPGDGWVGNRGRKLRIEAFSILPVETLSARDIQFRAFGPNGRETPWVTDANLCGTRGRGLPLTGFAVRLGPLVRDRYDVVYQGAFFESGVSTSCSNGEPCKARIADDPLEAINIRVVERNAE